MPNISPPAKSDPILWSGDPYGHPCSTEATIVEPLSVKYGCEHGIHRYAGKEKT